MPTIIINEIRFPTPNLLKNQIEKELCNGYECTCHICQLRFMRIQPWIEPCNLGLTCLQQHRLMLTETSSSDDSEQLEKSASNLVMANKARSTIHFDFLPSKPHNPIGTLDRPVRKVWQYEQWSTQSERYCRGPEFTQKLYWNSTYVSFWCWCARGRKHERHHVRLLKNLQIVTLPCNGWSNGRFCALWMGYLLVVPCLEKATETSLEKATETSHHHNQDSDSERKTSRGFATMLR